MAFDVTFQMYDELNRETTKRFHNTNALIADVLTDVAAMSPLLAAVIQGGLSGVIITQSSTGGAFSPSAEESNIDEGMRIAVRGGDNERYSVGIPMPRNDLRQAGGVINVADPDLVAFLAEFDGLAGNNWRINLKNPTTIATVLSGTLDK